MLPIRGLGKTQPLDGTGFAFNARSNMIASIRLEEQI